MTKGTQQFLCYSTDTVTGSHSNTFRRSCTVCVYVYIYKFQNRTSPQFYSNTLFYRQYFLFLYKHYRAFPFAYGHFVSQYLHAYKMFPVL